MDSSIRLKFTKKNNDSKVISSVTRKNDRICLRNSGNLNDDDQEEEKKKESRFHWLLEKDNLKTKDILKNNHTSKERDKIIFTIQGLGILIKI